MPCGPNVANPAVLPCMLCIPLWPMQVTVSSLLRDDGQGLMWYYFVHYNGWNKKYDTWVEDAGLIKMPAGSEAGPAVRGQLMDSLA